MTGPKPNGSFIVSRAYDLALFVGPPIWALVLGIVIAFVPKSEFELGPETFTWSSLFIGVFIHAHLVLVFVRSHGNANVRRRFPVRFLVVPLLLWAAMIASPIVLITCSVLATFWDVYHSGAQTFGFARIYDRKHGNDPTVGRGLDFALNQLLYAGPIVAGATMLDHFEDFREFELVGIDFFSAVPVWMDGHQGVFARVIVGGGIVFLVGYLVAYARLAARGYRVSPLKIALLVGTGACSIWTWGFNSFGEAFFIMNFFHALQYFGIVWATERRNLLKLLRLDGIRGGTLVLLILVVSLPFAYGFFVQALDTELTSLWALTLVVALMHFWYDGFVWSVRDQDPTTRV